MDYCCYILYSKSLDCYYVGYTSDLNERIKQHKIGYFGVKSFTSRADDWQVFIVIPYLTIEQAVQIESEIKKMKSRKYIENLKHYPELIINLVKKHGIKG